MNITQRIAFLKQSNAKLDAVHAAAGNILDNASTVDQLASNLDAIKALEAAVAALREQAEAAVMFNK